MKSLPLFLTLVIATSAHGQTQLVEQKLNPSTASTKRPQGWYYGEFHRGPMKLWTISKEDAADQKYKTGVRIQAISKVSKLVRKSPADFVKLQVAASRRRPGIKIVVEPKETKVPSGTRLSMETEEGDAHVAYDFYWGTSELDNVVMLVYGAPKAEWDSAKEALRTIANLDPNALLNPAAGSSAPATKPIKSDALSKSLTAIGYRGIKLERVPSGHLHLAVRINGGKPLRFLCDSGANVTLITPAVVKRLKLTAIDAKGTVAGLGGKQQKALMAPIQTLQIGAFTSPWQSVKVVDIAGLNRQFVTAGDIPVDGVLGADWMEKHSALIDVAKGRLFFKKRP